MPIFEYRCQSCGHHFEYLTRAGGEATCPACESQALTKQLSTFAVGGNAAGSRAGVGATNAFRAQAGHFDNAQGRPCGSCGDPRGPGACSMN